MTLSNKVYDVLKSIAQVFLPALGTLYFALAGIWAFPDAAKVVGSITALDTFLGVCLSLLARTYKAPTDGHLIVDKSDPIKDVYRLELSTPVEELAGKNAITLAVGEDSDGHTAAK